MLDDGCHMDFDSLDCIEGSKIIVLQYPMFVLLVLLVLYKSSIGVICERVIGFEWS